MALMGHDTEDPLTALVHPRQFFGQPPALLKYELDHLELFTPNTTTLDQAFELITTFTGFFSDEKQRETALKPILRLLLPGNAKGQESNWFEGIFTYLIVELKNEQGLGGDPFYRV
jgi:hypothetical protein